MNLNQIARICHEANRAIQIATGDPAVSPQWDDAPEWQRESAIEGVQKAIEGATPEQLHLSWVAFKVNDGWCYGHKKDAGAKTHPCIVDYDELPDDQKAKDAVFSAIVKALAPTA